MEVTKSPIHPAKATGFKRMSESDGVTPNTILDKSRGLISEYYKSSKGFGINVRIKIMRASQPINFLFESSGTSQ